MREEETAIQRSGTQTHVYTHILYEAGHCSADGSCIKAEDGHEDKVRPRNAENGNAIVTRKLGYLGEREASIMR